MKHSNYLFSILSVFSLMIFMASPLFGQQPLKIIILRHAEKPDQGDNLSCAGFNRALKLPAVIVSKFGVPNYLYVPSPSVGKVTKTLRMTQTISPLAIKYNLPINTNYDVAQTKKLAAKLLKKSGTVIVVWEHKNIPDIISALGINTKQLKWQAGDFDSLWIVTISGSKSTLVKDNEGIHPMAGCAF